MTQAVSPQLDASTAEPSDFRRRRAIPAWILSATVHFLAFILLVVFVRVVPRGADVEPNRKGGIALVKMQQGKHEYLTEDDFDKPEESSSPAISTTIASVLPSPDRPPIDLAGVLPSPQHLTGISSDISSALPNASGLTQGVGPSKDITGGKTQTEVFGVRGVGSRFVYCFDRSGSMSAWEGRPLRAAKAKLIASLQSLKRTDQFQIIFYNQEPLVFNPNPGRKPTMLYGTEENKKLAERFIRRVTAAGGTRPMPALRLALNLGPDVLFLLSDAEETVLDMAQIDRWNYGTSINAIEFGTNASPSQFNSLARLAEKNHGQYKYRDVRKLREN